MFEIAVVNEGKGLNTTPYSHGFNKGKQLCDFLFAFLGDAIN